MSTIPAQTRVGVVGCGNIATKAYLPRMPLYGNLEVVACADLDADRTRVVAEQFTIRAHTVEELLAADDIDLVVNLTIPQAHRELDERALAAGKHVFSEKPFTLDMAEARSVLAAAAKADRRLGCAPDTVLGASTQSCRALLDDGAIGRPLAFAAVMQCGGHETWHPSPEFYYLRGGGPMFDMGPYYLHALITLLGPVKRVAGITTISFPERVITSEPKKGQRIPVEVPTHVTSLLEFHNGVVGTLVTSFDVRGPYSNPVIEIYGEAGSLRVPDPNNTKGTPLLGALGKGGQWQEMPLTHPYNDEPRGLGVADMAAAIASGRDHRANERVAVHAVEIMEAIHVSSAEGRHVTLETTCERPAAMRTDLPKFTLE